MKLTEAMGKNMGKKNIAHEGGPCPFCHGERKVTVFVSVLIRRRQIGQQAGKGTLRGQEMVVARPSFWQGACMECAAEIQDGLALRAGRFDYLEKVSGEDQE